MERTRSCQRDRKTRGTLERSPESVLILISSRSSSRGARSLFEQLRLNLETLFFFGFHQFIRELQQTRPMEIGRNLLERKEERTMIIRHCVGRTPTRFPSSGSSSAEGAHRSPRSRCKLTRLLEIPVRASARQTYFSPSRVSSSVFILRLRFSPSGGSNRGEST